MVRSDAQEAKSDAGDVCVSEELFKAEPRDNLTVSHDDTGGYRNQKSATVSSSGLLAQENSDSKLKGNKNHESSETYHYQQADRHHQGPHNHGSIVSKPTNSFSTDVFGGLPQKEASRANNDLYAVVPHKPMELSGVLDSLKQAKLSLQQELSRSPLADNGYASKAIKPVASASKTEDRLGIPIGCSGLFRLPTDFSDEAITRSNALDSAFRMSPNFYLDKEIARTSGDQFGTSSHVSTSLTHLYYPESGSRFVTTKPPSDPFSDAGLPSSSNNLYPNYPIYPSYQNLAPPIPFSDGLSRPYQPSRPVGVPPADRFSFYDDHVRPQNTYR